MLSDSEYTKRWMKHKTNQEQVKYKKMDEAHQCHIKIPKDPMSIQLFNEDECVSKKYIYMEKNNQEQVYVTSVQMLMDELTLKDYLPSFSNNCLK